MKFSRWALTSNWVSLSAIASIGVEDEVMLLNKHIATSERENAASLLEVDAAWFDKGSIIERLESGDEHESILHATMHLGEVHHDDHEDHVKVPTPDFLEMADVDRYFVDNYPQEELIEIPMAKNNIQVETVQTDMGPVPHVVIPMDHHFVDMVMARTTLNNDGHFRREFGDLRWIMDFGDPVFSPVPGNIVAVAERFHVYEHDGGWGGAEETEFPITEREQEAPEVTANAVDRSRKVYQFLNNTGFGTLMMAGGFDPLAIRDLSTFLAENPFPSESDSAKKADFKDMIKKGKEHVIGMPTGTPPTHITTSCYHLLSHPAVILDRENNNIKLPVGVLLPTFRAHLIHSPRYQFASAFGHGHATIENGNLYLFTAGSMFGSFFVNRKNMGTPQATSKYSVPPAVFISSPGGTDYPSAEVQAVDLRATEHNPVTSFFATIQSADPQFIGADSAFHKLFMNYAVEPLSYVYLYQDMDQSCPQKVLDDLMAHVRESDWVTIVQDGVVSPEEAAAINTGWFDAMACGKHFVSGADDYSNGMDLMEMVGWSHFNMEWHVDHRLHAIRGGETLADDWHWKHMPSWDDDWEHPLLSNSAPMPHKQPC